jgi:hypothetical protein
LVFFIGLFLYFVQVNHFATVITPDDSVNTPDDSVCWKPDCFVCLTPDCFGVETFCYSINGVWVGGSDDQGFILLYC